jgi:dGTPase
MDFGNKWAKLLSPKRLGADKPAEILRGRTQYQRDFDRIVFSSAFRRLQDKTQVFPLAESDYVRTRLTHSIEASCVSRSLGAIVGEKLIKKYNLQDFQPSDFVGIGDIRDIWT